MPEFSEWQLRVDSLLAHAGCGADLSTGDLVNPLHLSTTFERDPDGGYSKSYLYSRIGNPTRSELEEILARIEGGRSCYTFSTGMGAACAILLAVEPGSTIVLPHDVFHGISKAIQQTPGLSVNIQFVDYDNAEDVDAAMQKHPAIVWIETPSNPMLRITDIASISRKAHNVDALVIVDGTWTTPLIQQPLNLGADVVFHSLTKYLSGHSDVMGGAVVCRVEGAMHESLRQIQQLGGNILDPFSCWLTMRSLRTLPLRLQKHCDNAQVLADYLRDHPSVSAVHFPGLVDHPSFSIAKDQMKRPGGMISFQVGNSTVDSSSAMNVVAKLRLIRRATSLGSTESLIEHRASIEGDASLTPQNLLRLSVGLEDSADLIADLQHALS